MERIVYTPVEAAKLLGVDRATVYRWMRTGAIPAVKMGDTGRVFIPKRPFDDLFGVVDPSVRGAA